MVGWLSFVVGVTSGLTFDPTVPTAPEASRADEKEPGGPAPRAGGETPPTGRGESQLGGPAQDSGTAETRRLQVKTPTHVVIHYGLALRDALWTITLLHGRKLHHLSKQVVANNKYKHFSILFLRSHYMIKVE